MYNLAMKTSDYIKDSEDVTAFTDKNNEMKTTSALIGFVASEQNYVEPECSYRFSTVDHLYEKAIAECLVIKDSNKFLEGILLKCIDKKPMFPYLHYSHFQSYSHNDRMKQIEEVIEDCQKSSGSLYGNFITLKCQERFCSNRCTHDNINIIILHSAFILFFLELNIA
uniref:DUF7153 domain-containing protein n=1 Tax=Heterorhabditis bacteriophora TaxID=37862 RepID=A0A1I7WYR0_HETBA